jgi:hypothetical protein
MFIKNLIKVPVVLSLLLVATNIAAESPSPSQIADMMAEMKNYTLEVKTTENYMTAMNEMADLAKANPSILDSLKAKSKESDLSVKALAKEMENHSEFGPILKKHGLTGIDFVMIPGAFMQAAMLSQATPEMVKMLGATANPANLEFMNKNRDSLVPKMQAGMQRWSALSGE